LVAVVGGTIGAAQTLARRMVIPKRPSPPDLTELLLAWSAGDEGAFDKLVPLVYQELRRLARRWAARRRGGPSLQTTDLVHEAYLRLIDAGRVQWQDRVHFFAVSAQVMRRILVDFARKRLSLKRGGGSILVSIDEALGLPVRPDADLVALDEALTALGAFDARKQAVVELRFFGGLSAEEAAEALKVSPRTVEREWHLARSWLHRELTR
jgi:RNA polymerase sigma factor (TIGR02999 family)